MAVSFVNGERARTCSVYDRGLQYGDGLFETMLCLRGVALDFTDHWRRLLRGCDALGIALERCEEHVLALIREYAPPRAVAKVIVTRGESERGYRTVANARATWVLSLHEAPEPPRAIYEQGVELTICRTTIACEDTRLVGLKHLNRLTQVLARREWEERFHDGLLKDDAGKIIEGCASNLFFVSRGRLHTPDLTRAGVWGVVRARVLKHAAQRGTPVSIAAVTERELSQADEVFVTNSVYGIVPVRGVASWSFPVGELARSLRRELWHS